MRLKPPSEFLVVAFWAVLSSLALLGVDAHYAPFSLAALLGLHFLIAVCLYLALVIGHHLGEITGWVTFTGLVAGAGAGLVLVWHGRELTYRPSSLVATLAVALVLAVPVHLVMVGSPPRLSPGRAWVALGGAVALLVGLIVAAFHTSPTLRWHLLRHNKMLGTPAYYLLADSIAGLETELFDRYRPAQDPGIEPGKDPLPGKDPVPGDIVESVRNSTMGDQPHLIFILLDTLRADALTLGGASEDLMPRLNAFLGGAHRFGDVVANASWTRPSMASMWTGLLPEEHGARDVNDPLEDSHTTLAEVLGARGYETAAFVSNVGAVGRGAGFAQGFEFFYEFSDQPYARAGRIRQTLEHWLDGPWAKSRERLESGEPRPLFLYLHFLDPHDPYLAGHVPASKSRAEYQEAYRRELRYLDDELGLLLELLESRLPGRRAVLVTSDHGEEFGEHEEYGHGYSLYRELVHIPLAFHTGDGQGDLRQPLEGRDVFDLVTSWSKPAWSNPGGSTAPFDVAAWAESRRRSQRYASIYYSSEGRLLLRPYLSKVCMRTVESDGYKMIWSAYGDTTELYELTTDPNERRNLAGEHPEIVAQLRERLEKVAPQWEFPDPYERSEEESEQLRALGYLDN